MPTVEPRSFPSPDPRPARTRARLAGALSQLLVEDGGDLSVTAIARRARLNRSSFYAHFPTVSHLAVFSLREQFAEIAEIANALEADGDDPRDGTRESLRRVSILVRRHARVLVGDSPSSAAIPLLSQLLAECVSHRLHRLNDPRSALEQLVERTYVAAGLAGLLVAWVEGRIEATVDELVDLQIRQLPPTLTVAASAPRVLH